MSPVHVSSPALSQEPPHPDLGPIPASKQPSNYKGGRHEAASSLVVAALYFLMPIDRRASPVESPEVQPANPHLSLHLQLHREGYSLRSEATSRVGSGAADRPASDCPRSVHQGSRQN